MEKSSKEELESDWTLYNTFTKRLKPGCSRKYRKKLLLETNIPGLSEDEIPRLKAYVNAIDEQLDMVTPSLEELRFQHSVTPMIGFTFGLICSVVMVMVYLM